MDRGGIARRPIKARNTLWASRMANWLERLGVRPNTISVTSVFFAGAAGLCLVWTDGVAGEVRGLLFLLSGVLIQMRLLCNLLDGMVAVEGGHKTKSGEIYNELPDRLADVFILVGAGYAWMRVEWGPLLGWLCAVLALLTAYVRALGAAAGASQQFCGPMAKQQRMALMTFACIVSAFLSWSNLHWPLVAATLTLIGAGTAITVVRRLLRIVRELEQR
jgi:phosphatidylglycerophosphate synthase